MNARFQHCLNLARQIVSAYRDEAPEGCDPQNSMAVIGIAGTAVAVGGGLYAANQQKKAAEKAGSVEYNTESVLLDDPKKVNPMKVLQSLYGVNMGNSLEARQQAGSVNKFNLKQALKSYNQILPGFSQLQGQLSQNAQSFAAGELPQDVQSQITRMSAQRGIQGGFGLGSQGASGGALGNLNLRNLGLTSLDLAKYGSQFGMQLTGQARSLMPNLMGQQDYMLTPQQSLGIQQGNVNTQNQFALQNNALQNQSVTAQNQALSQRTQQQYAADLMQAQMIGQTASQVGGLMSGTAAQLYQPAPTTAGWGGNYSPTGARGSALYNGGQIPAATLV